MMRTDLDVFLQEQYARANNRSRFEASAHRDIGILEFHLNKSVELFKKHVKQSVQIEFDLRHRDLADRRSIHEYQRVLDALAIAEFALAKQYCAIIDTSREGLRSHPFDRALGLTVKAFVEGAETPKALEGLGLRSQKERSLVGIHQFLTAVDARDSTNAQTAVVQMANDHRQRMCRGIFQLRLDRHLYMWGIGLINLARGVYGLEVHGHEPIIPEALLAPVGDQGMLAGSGDAVQGQM